MVYMQLREMGAFVYPALFMHLPCPQSLNILFMLSYPTPILPSLFLSYLLLLPSYLPCSHTTLPYYHPTLPYYHPTLPYSHHTLSYSHPTLPYSHLALPYPSYITLLHPPSLPQSYLPIHLSYLTLLILPSPTPILPSHITIP